MTTIEPFINRIIHGDCIEVMRTMPETSVNLIVTDPPYIVNYRSRDGRRCANDDNHRWLAARVYGYVPGTPTRQLLRILLWLAQGRMLYVCLA